MDFSPYVSQLSKQHSLCQAVKRAKAAVESLSRDRDLNRQLQQHMRDSMGGEKEVMILSSQGFLHLSKADAYSEVVRAQAETLKAIEDNRRSLDRTLQELTTMQLNYDVVDAEVQKEMQRYVADNE